MNLDIKYQQALIGSCVIAERPITDINWQLCNYNPSHDLQQIKKGSIVQMVHVVLFTI